jgi:folate-binding protein YgfZ
VDPDAIHRGPDALADRPAPDPADAEAVVDVEILAEADALDDGEAFVVLDGYVSVAVTGDDALDWLHDLLTADLRALPVDGAVRSFVLTPTGRIRTEVRAIRRSDGIALLEPADEPRSIGEILAPYVLTSDVTIASPEPVTVVSTPWTGADAIDADVPATRVTPSILGPGSDRIVSAGDAETTRTRLVAGGMREARSSAAEIVRVRRGIPRWRVDVTPDTFPVGARVDDAVAFAKGCYLGQEAVARIRNLGHPPTVLRHLVARTSVRVGDAVIGPDGGGEVTSAAPSRAPGGTVVLARVDHRVASNPLTLADGTPLVDAGTSSPS